MTSTKTKYPLPDLSGLDSAFGSIAHLPKYSELDEEFRSNTAPECRAAQMIFFKGGRLEDHGFEVKPGLNTGKVYRALQAALCSFEPKHEHKIAGVGALIRDWCEPVKTSATA